MALYPGPRAVVASSWNHKSVLPPILRDARKGALLSMRSNLLKHNNLMLRSERRERLEAWAASDEPIRRQGASDHRILDLSLIAEPSTTNRP